MDQFGLFLKTFFKEPLLTRQLQKLNCQHKCVNVFIPQLYSQSLKLVYQHVITIFNQILLSVTQRKSKCSSDWINNCLFLVSNVYFIIGQTCIFFFIYIKLIPETLLENICIRWNITFSQRRPPIKDKNKGLIFN